MPDATDKPKETIYYIERDDGMLVRVPASKLSSFDPHDTVITEADMRTASELVAYMKSIRDERQRSPQSDRSVVPNPEASSDLSTSPEEEASPGAAPPRRPKHSAPTHGVPVWIVVLLVLIIGILLGVIIARPSRSSELSGAAALDAALQKYVTPRPAATPTPTAKPTPTPAPNKAVSGTVFLSPRSECLAPLTIEAPISADCYVRLYNLLDHGDDVGVYVRAGASASLDVPLGVYELYYATGFDWKGIDAADNLVFGPDTQWHTSDNTFRFYVDGEYYSGHTVTLYSVPNGNWDTKTIDETGLPF